MDLARGLSTRLEDAERFKVLHGSVLAGSNDSEDMISVNSMDQDDPGDLKHIPKGHLTRIIRPRVEETLELIRDRLARSGFADAVGKRIVLTGGASQLTGVGELARRIMSKHVRVGRPMGIKGMPDAAKGPAFSTAVGLLVYPQIAQLELLSGRNMPRRARLTGTGGVFQRFGLWLRESM
jgi:cell division protein FtsA